MECLELLTWDIKYIRGNTKPHLCSARSAELKNFYENTWIIIWKKGQGENSPFLFWNKFWTPPHLRWETKKMTFLRDCGLLCEFTVPVHRNSFAFFLPPLRPREGGRNLTCTIVSRISLSQANISLPRSPS